MKVQEFIDNCRPYQRDAIPARICLDANESPFGLPEKAISDFRDLLSKYPANRYPGQPLARLAELTAGHAGTGPERLYFANGGDEIISQLCRAYLAPGVTVAVSRPGFAMYGIYAGQAGAEILPYDSWDPSLSGIPPARVVFIDSPNNPTGMQYDKPVILDLVKSRPDTLIVLDEAYIEFGGGSMIGLAGAYPNLVVLRTFSKAFGLAGVRLGYAAMPDGVLSAMRKIMHPYQVGILSQIMGIAVLQNTDIIRPRIEEIKRERGRLAAALGKLLEIGPLNANFIYGHGPKAGEVHARLLEQGIRARDFKEAIRITVGDKAENDEVISCLKQIQEDWR